MFCSKRNTCHSLPLLERFDNSDTRRGPCSNNFPCAVIFPWKKHRPRRLQSSDKNIRFLIGGKRSLTSKPCNLPTSIMSLAAFGITRITWTAAFRASISEFLCVRSVSLNASLRRSWYLVILCTGFIKRSHNCNRWPSFCLSSCSEARSNCCLLRV